MDQVFDLPLPAAQRLPDGASVAVLADLVVEFGGPNAVAGLLVQLGGSLIATDLLVQMRRLERLAQLRQDTSEARLIAGISVAIARPPELAQPLPQRRRLARLPSPLIKQRRFTRPIELLLVERGRRFELAAQRVCA